jgi:formylglycine-generating enzyme
LQTGPANAMAQILGGTFRMGSDAHYPEERPAHDVTVDGFGIDRRAVTSADFAALRVATGYVTFAERPLDPALYPGVRPELLTRPSRPVRPRDRHDWREYVPRADGQHPEGLGSTLAGRESEPVAHVAYEDAAAYAAWAGEDLPTEADREFAARGRPDGAANGPTRWPRISTARAREWLWHGPTGSRVRAAFMPRFTT